MLMNLEWTSILVLILPLLTIGCGCTDTEVSKMQSGFYWAVTEQIAGMPRPGATVSLENDLNFLQAKKIDLLVSLTEQTIPPTDLVSHDIDGLHLPIPDYQAPTMEQMTTFATTVSGVIAQGGRVGTHCAGGKGRTGTMLAVYLVHIGMTATAAIARIRQLSPGSIETAAQEAAVAEYYQGM